LSHPDSADEPEGQADAGLISLVRKGLWNVEGLGGLEILPSVSAFWRGSAWAETSDPGKRWGIVGNRVALAVYTFRQSRYMFPVLPELAVVPILRLGGCGKVQSSRSPWGQSFGAEPGHRKSTGSSRKEQGVSLEDDVKKIVSEKLSVSADDVKMESNFIDDLKADSLDIVELGMAFEDKFGVSIPDEDYEKLRTVKDAVQYIESHK